MPEIVRPNKVLVKFLTTYSLYLTELRTKASIYTPIVGLDGLPKMLVNLLLPDNELIDTITVGNDWLVKEASGFDQYLP